MNKCLKVIKTILKIRQGSLFWYVRINIYNININYGGIIAVND